MLLVAVAIMIAAFSPACATKKFVLREVGSSVQASEQKLSARLDSHDHDIQSNSSQIGELITVNKQNKETLDTVKGDLRAAADKASAAGVAADQARGTADRATASIADLSHRFQNRNQYNLVAEKVVSFGFGESKLPENQTDQLDEAANLLKENPDMIAVLEGRTDSTGDKDFNIRLGQKRLEGVARYLIVEKGVPAYQIHEMSFGPDQPIADNGTKEGRAKNRSAVVNIYAPKDAAVPQVSSR
jgi:outer membrane protein OmpA-like peptidoglycan-associated protein